MHRIRGRSLREQSLRRSAAFHIRYMRRQIREYQRLDVELNETIAFCRGAICALAICMFSRHISFTRNSWWTRTWYQVHEDTSARSRKDDVPQVE